MKGERNRFPLASVEIACESWQLRSLSSADPRGEVADRRRDFLFYRGRYYYAIEQSLQ
jgi:hypothetical protein